MGGRGAGRAVAATAVVTVLLAGCGGATPAGPGSSSQGAGASSSPTVAPTPAATPRVTPIRGFSSCMITSYDEATPGPSQSTETVTEHFRCTYRASDPRIEGLAEADFTTTFEPAGSTTARWEGIVTITNDDGAWTGPAKGALVFWPGRGGPYNYGEGVYEGSGAYEGLVYHELIAGSDSGIDVSGWIEPGG